jgi:amidohydrolase
MSDKNIVQFRHELHRHPELSGSEAHTSRRVIDFIRACAPDEIIDRIAGHGLVAGWDFGPGGPEVAIRCELDALPIDEANRFAHASGTAGVSHKCGHDGHMAIVASLAVWLATRPFDRGRVRLLFQAAEENGEGAKAMLADPQLAGFAPDYIFALHNLPGYPLHEVLVVQRQFSATVLSLAIHFEGVMAHAAHPETGRNPSLAISEAMLAIQQLANPDPAQESFTLVTPVYTRIGAPDYGIAAAEGELHLTLRTWSETAMRKLLESIGDIVSAVCEKNGLGHTTEQFDYFPAVVNDEHCNALIAAAARRHGCGLRELPVPMRFGEDFGYFTRKGKGAMFGLGAGLDTPPLHSLAYDFPDDLLETGTALFKGIISSLMDAAGDAGKG